MSRTIYNFKDFKDKTFKNWKVLEEVEFIKGKQRQLLCECLLCNTIHRVYATSLIRGTSANCSACRYKKFEVYSTTHGKCGTRLHSIWNKMKDRCYNKNSQDYSYYGGRGIIVCEEWLNDFKVFFDWAIANGYKHNLTLDREDNDFGYAPNNCRWVTRLIQARNQRANESNPSGIKGVHFHSKSGKWEATINRDAGKIQYLGLYDTIEEAAHMRKAAEELYWHKE